MSSFLLAFLLGLEAEKASVLLIRARITFHFLACYALPGHQNTEISVNVRNLMSIRAFLNRTLSFFALNPSKHEKPKSTLTHGHLEFLVLDLDNEKHQE